MMLGKSFRAQVVRTVLSAGTALIVLFPRASSAEVVEDYEREGEYEEDGMRFESVVIKGELFESPNAPGGMTLLRTFENKSDDAAHVVVEERVLRTQVSYQGRTGAMAEPVMTRTQKIDLKPHEKKAIGVYLPEKLAVQIAHHRKVNASNQARITAGADMSRLPDSADYGVDYLKPLPPGATAARHPTATSLRGMLAPRPSMPGRLALGLDEGF